MSQPSTSTIATTVPSVPMFSIGVLDPALTGQPPYPSSTGPYLPALTAQTLMTAEGLEERATKRPRLSPSDQQQGLTPSAGTAPAGSQDDNPDDLYAGPGGVPRLPPIMQVEKQQVTTSATQAASASRRRNEANFVCPVPNCGSTFTRRFNLRGHLRSHTEERPFVCDWVGCNKGFARQHDCKRHQALHTAKNQTNRCPGCHKTFSRLDALNRHLKSDAAVECRKTTQELMVANNITPAIQDPPQPIVQVPVPLHVPPAPAAQAPSQGDLPVVNLS